MTYGRIKPGTKVLQDFRWATWPYTVGEHYGGLAADPNTRFKFVKDYAGVHAIAPQYGGKPYGNGCLTLEDTK